MKQIDLNDAWLLYEGNEAMSFSRGQKEGKTVNLPHDFIVTKPRTADAAGGAGTGYFGEGEGIYKKDLKVPAEWQGKTVLLDIDGACGGYNLQWAWASGYVAGLHGAE